MPIDNGTDVPAGLPDTDRVAVLARTLAAWATLPAPGPWVEYAACARLGFPAADVFTAERPDPEHLAAAVEVCRRCPVLDDCGSYAASTRAYGLWGGRWLRAGVEAPAPVILYQPRARHTPRCGRSAPSVVSSP